MNVDYYVFTNQGDRKYNEDYSLTRICESSSCFIVNDGLGGCGNGGIASELVAKTMGNHFTEGVKGDFLESYDLFTQTS